MTEPETVSPEARARAVAYWENEVRPILARKEQAAAPKETPEQALHRLRTEASKPVEIGKDLAAKLFAMRQESRSAA